MWWGVPRRGGRRRGHHSTSLPSWHTADHQSARDARMFANVSRGLSARVVCETKWRCDRARFMFAHWCRFAFLYAPRRRRGQRRRRGDSGQRRRAEVSPRRDCLARAEEERRSSRVDRQADGVYEWYGDGGRRLRKRTTVEAARRRRTTTPLARLGSWHGLTRKTPRRARVQPDSYEALTRTSPSTPRCRAI